MAFLSGEMSIYSRGTIRKEGGKFRPSGAPNFATFRAGEIAHGTPLAIGTYTILLDCIVDGPTLHILHCADRNKTSKAASLYQRLTALLVSREGLTPYSSTAACAAARRAMGTRKGEQLT